MTGLSEAEVKQRIEEGKVNIDEHPHTRTYKQIILGNALTFFNFLNLVLVVLVLSVGSFKNSLFVGVVIINTTIGIIQEVRAKKTLDDLAIMTQSKSVVIREGQKWSVATEEIVLDDLLVLKNGDQIPADAVVLEGEIEVNESLLTGESDNLLKQSDAELFSGSFVTAGECIARVTHVGKDNYAAKITDEAKEFKVHKSELRDSLNAILKFISIIIVPLGIMLFYKSYVISGNGLQVSVVSMTSALLGMIPEGLVLLTSVTLTVGSVVLAQKKALVQELYCIETLARVDTLCLDKTGTITEGTMRVEDVLLYRDIEMAEEDPDQVTLSENAYDESAIWEEAMGQSAPDYNPQKKEISHLSLDDVEKVMGNMMRILTDDNATAQALRSHFRSRRDLSYDHVIPFSSERKYSGVSFEGEGTYLMGAAQFLFPQGHEGLIEKCRDYAKDGLRVLVLAHSSCQSDGNERPADLTPEALFLITDVIREEAPDTLRYFREQGVDLKVISGDDPVTVSAIAARAGLPGAEMYVDATTLKSSDDLYKAVARYTVFGRVTPAQKKQMVMALKSQGRTVAMTGDGVNDVLALKEADCSIAMAGGSDAAKNTANIVLLDSNFATMPHIVNQGRRVVNNIRMAASMFLIKTIFSVFLALLTIFFGSTYPFEPIQMSLISACSVGIPTFFLSQEPNYEKIDHTFLRHVLLNAVPAAISISACVFALMLVCQHVYHDTTMLNTACVLVTGWNYMSALRIVYTPLTAYRKLVINTMQVAFFVIAVLFQNIFAMQALQFGMIILVFVLMTFMPMGIDALTGIIKRMYGHFLKEGPNNIADWFYGLFVKKRR